MSPVIFIAMLSQDWTGCLFPPFSRYPRSPAALSSYSRTVTCWQKDNPAVRSKNKKQETKITQYVIWNGEYTSVALFREWEVLQDTSGFPRLLLPGEITRSKKQTEGFSDLVPSPHSLYHSTAMLFRWLTQVISTPWLQTPFSIPITL